MIKENTIDLLLAYTAQKIQLRNSSNILSNDMLLAKDVFEEGSDIFINLHDIHANPKKHMLHGHDFFEMNYVIKGKVHQLMEDEKEENIYTAGTVCIMNPNSKHDIYVEHSDDFVLNIAMKQSLFTSTFLSMIQQHEYLGQFFLNYFLAQEKSSSHLLFDLQPADEMEDVLDAICREYLNAKPYYQLTMRYMLMIFFTELIRSYNKIISSRKFESKTNAQIISLFNYLSVNYPTATLESTAAYFHYHPNYLSAFVKKHTGKTFRSLLNDIKLTQATYYLQNTNMPIKDIAEHLGFLQLCNFYDFIKRNCGTTPAKMRHGKN